MTMSRAFLILAALAFALTNASALTVYNIDSGWYDSTGFHDSTNTNYVAGTASEGVQYHDYFSFNLAGVSGTVTSAIFTVYSYNISASGTYTIYGTSLDPAAVAPDCSTCTAIYNDLAANPIGTLTVDPIFANSNVTILFDAAGVAWLNANEGGSVVLGGVFPQPSGDDDNFIFSGSGFTSTNNLQINETPEPSTMLLLGGGLLVALGAMRRKLRA